LNGRWSDGESAWKRGLSRRVRKGARRPALAFWRDWRSCQLAPSVGGLAEASVTGRETLLEVRER
jgi:hypothetical protein